MQHAHMSASLTASLTATFAKLMHTGAQYITPPSGAERALTPGPEPETNKLRELNAPQKVLHIPPKKRLQL